MAVTPKRIDRISEEAHKLQFGRAVLTILFMPVFLIGWLIGKAWRAVTFVIAALKVGFLDGKGS